MHPGIAIVVLWGAWAISWFLAARWSRRPAARLGLRRELGYRLVLLGAGAALFVRAHGYEGSLRLWHVGWTVAWLCVALCACGFAFCWWARIHLGALWSASITRKPEHRIVDTGPYALVRHPIYTGVLMATLGTAVAKGTVPGVVGFGLMTLGFFMKARLEEAWLREELGAEAYDAYRRRVPMLIPFGPTARA
jgi:protein-S-isoprenylcysteine O-methyltransferase Ste14